MRALLLAAVIGLALLAGATPAAVSLPPADLSPAQALGPVPELAAPELPAPDLPAPDLPAAPALPTPPSPLAAEPIMMPRNPMRPGIPFETPNITLPPVTPATATAVGGAALALVGFALYSRLARGQLLDHERRDGVYQLVRGEPGISLTDIASRTGLGWGTAVYHLERLEKAGFVTSEKNGARRCYFPIGEVPRDARPHLGALQQEALRNVASFVHERPGATQTELADALGLTASAASKQITKLESVGLVRREREWKTVRLHPEPKLAELLVPAAVATA